MNGSNAWAEFAGVYRLTRSAALDRAKSELKTLVPEDAKEASGYGLRAKRTRSGAISFDVLEVKEALKRLRADHDGVVSFEYIIVATCIVIVVIATGALVTAFQER
jgi:Flp pilus assembly pilin Flp